MDKWAVCGKEPDYDDEAPSLVPCYSCQGPMVMGEEKAGGLCTKCYFEAVNQDEDK